MTKMIPVDVPSVDNSTSSSTSETRPSTSTQFYSFIPTVNGVLDLSPSAPACTFVGSNLVIPASTVSVTTSEIDTSSFPFTPSLATSWGSSVASPTSPTSSSALSTSSRTSLLNEDEEGMLDPTVVQAAYSAVESGLLTPLIKEELRCTIQTKRLKKGEDELVVEHNVRAEDELTPEDLEKRMRRRERNKLAAQRCRNKRREKADVLENETSKLEVANSALKKQIKELELEKQKLTLLLQCHDTSFHNCPQNTKLKQRAETTSISLKPSDCVTSSSNLLQQCFPDLEESSSHDLFFSEEVEVEVMDMDMLDENNDRTVSSN